MRTHIEKHRIQNKPMTKVTLFLDRQFDQCGVVCSGLDNIVATTDGSIKRNEILLTHSVAKMSLFVEPKNDFSITVNYYYGHVLTHSDTEEIKNESAKELPSSHVPVIFYHRWLFWEAFDLKDRAAIYKFLLLDHLYCGNLAVRKNLEPVWENRD